MSTLNLDAIRQRFEKLSSNGGKKWFWKPGPGQHQVRIVPYVHNPAMPFVELFFHYGIGANNKNYISPISFQRPDPFVDAGDKLQSTGDKEDWKFGAKLKPAMRIYCPVIIRGQESDGVKIWAISKTVYKEILGYITDPDYGDITDPKTGRDLVVTIEKEAGKSYPTTSIKVKPNQSALTAELLRTIQEQPVITSLWEEPSYEELQRALDSFINGGPAEDTSTPEVGARESKLFAPDSPAVDLDDNVPTTKTKTTTKATTPANKTEIDDLDAEFSKLLGNN